MNLLFATLASAGLDLFFFSLVFCIVMIGFAMSFYMAFGLDVHGYRTISNALLSLFQMVLGIFDYDELKAANRTLAPLLFATFVYTGSEWNGDVSFVAGEGAASLTATFTLGSSDVKLKCCVGRPARGHPHVVCCERQVLVDVLSGDLMAFGTPPVPKSF